MNLISGAESFTPKHFKFCMMYMNLAIEMSKFSTCSRVQVGAVLVLDNRPILSGYNGTPKGDKHCTDVFQEKFKKYCLDNREPISIFTFSDFMQLPEVKEEHNKFSRLHEVHAEANIIAQAANRGISVKDSCLFVTCSPCNDCSKLIISAGISKVIFKDLYDRETQGLEVMSKFGIQLYQLDVDNKEIKRWKLLHQNQ